MSSHEEDGTVSSFDTPEWPSSHAIFMRYAARRRGGLAAVLIIGFTAGIAYRLLMDPSRSAGWKCQEHSASRTAAADRSARDRAARRHHRASLASLSELLSGALTK